ncbi:MAG TPA: SGNH/GDSL hydrolase family protein [Beijerinckiaceae bacterium]|nr:SGNH/GDSL hydrolase family protein [Beijerinckiaceae bacterium]
MVRRMALAFFPPVLALLLTLSGGGSVAWAQTAVPVAPSPADAVDASLSPECRVPGSKLYTLAPLRAVKRALKESRAIHVLAIGSSSTVGIGASSPASAYPVRLEGELEKLFPGMEIEVTNRGLSGEVASGAAERMKNTIAEVEPDLVIWQVGTNDALARVDIDSFSQNLDDTIKWIMSHRIDVVLVDPQYTASLARDDHYGQIVKTIHDVARKDGVPLVLRYEAMRYLSSQPTASGRYLARDQFHLNDLGYRCMAEHVARAITLALVEPEQAAGAAAPVATATAPAK